MAGINTQEEDMGWERKELDGRERDLDPIYDSHESPQKGRKMALLKFETGWSLDLHLS